jgi:hypothetical protein
MMTGHLKSVMNLNRGRPKVGLDFLYMSVFNNYCLEYYEKLLTEVEDNGNQIRIVVPRLICMEKMIKEVICRLDEKDDQIDDLLDRLDQKNDQINGLLDRLGKAERLLAQDLTFPIPEVEAPVDRHWEEMADQVEASTSQLEDVNVRIPTSRPAGVSAYAGVSERGLDTAYARVSEPTCRPAELSAFAGVSVRGSDTEDSPPSPTPCPPAVHLQPPTPQTSEDANSSDPITLFEVPGAPIDPPVSTQKRKRSRSPSHVLTERRRSARLGPPTPSPSSRRSKRTTDTSVDEPRSKRRKGK